MTPSKVKSKGKRKVHEPRETHDSNIFVSSDAQALYESFKDADIIPECSIPMELPYAAYIETN